MPKNDDKLKCSFCGKTQDQVKKLIAGPDVCICDECIELCNEILDEELFNFKQEELFEIAENEKENIKLLSENYINFIQTMNIDKKSSSKNFYILIKEIQENKKQKKTEVKEEAIQKIEDVLGDTNSDR